MQQPNILKIHSMPYSDLHQRVDALLASHPETDDLMLTCREICHLLFEIERSDPGFADALRHRLERHLRQR